MRLLRVVAIGLLFSLAAIALAFWYVAQHQNELVQLVLTQVGQRTGLHIEASQSRLALGARLVVELENLRVTIDHREAARLGRVRAVFSYNTLVHRRGLPLYSLVLDRGTLTVTSHIASGGGQTVKTLVSRLGLLTRYLGLLSAVSRRFELLDIRLADQDQHSIAEHVNAVAYRAHYRTGGWPWIVRFSAEAGQPSIAGAQFAGEMRLGRSHRHPDTLGEGHFWFWELPRAFRIEDFTASARLLGDMRVSVSADAQIAGNFNCKASDLVVTGTPLTSPLSLGLYRSNGAYRISQARADLTHFVLRHKSSTVLEADATVLQPYEPSRTVTFSAGGLVVDAAGAVRLLRAWRSASPSMVHFAERLRSGDLAVTRAALKIPEPVAKLNLATLRKHLQVDAILTHLSYVQPPEGIPPVYEFDAQLSYSDQFARIRQGTGQVGGSSISDVSFDLDLQNAPNQMPYRLNLASWLDAADLYRSTGRSIEEAVPQLRGKVQWVHGHTPMELHARGTLEGLQPALPRDYLLKADFGDVQFQLLGLPAAASLAGGTMEFSPTGAMLKEVVVEPLGETGNAMLNGAILFNRGDADFHNFVVELHQVESAAWLPIFVKPDQLSVTGPLGGRLVANKQPGRTAPAVSGKLTLGGGKIQLGFLRSPIIVLNAATLTLDGKGLLLNIPASQIEGAPLDFMMKVADLDHPQMRIEASVERLDFEVMRFIRLPWSPGTPPQFFPLPVTGHIAARSGNFEKLPLTDISTDFTHNSSIWRVQNFHANAFNGTVDLNISGYSGPNDWINIKGTMAGVDAGPLLLISQQNRETPIVGKLAAQANLWANTDNDFFRTLAGQLSLTMTNGRLNRFTLLTRILSLVNLKNWLTAQMPDPRKSGLPFDVLGADLRGVKGVFHTDDFRLEGPVMDIVARGDIDLGNSTMNMEIDMLAFQTVNWLMSNIPIIGKNLAGGTKQLVGAYFQVKGPIDNPTIWPKPITSVAQFVFRALTLPLSIIDPTAFQ